jgi:hypothetical protein
VNLTGEIARLKLDGVFWIGTSLFMVLTLVAAIAPWRWTAPTALAILLLYQGWQIVRSADVLISRGGWSLLGG